MLKLLCSYLKLPHWNNGGMCQIVGGCVFKRMKKNWSDLKYERAHYFIKKENTQNTVIPTEQQNSVSSASSSRSCGGGMVPALSPPGGPAHPSRFALGADLPSLLRTKGLRSEVKDEP